MKKTEPQIIYIDETPFEDWILSRKRREEEIAISRELAGLGQTKEEAVEDRA